MYMYVYIYIYIEKCNNLQAAAGDLQYWADSYISHPHRTDDSLDV